MSPDNFYYTSDQTGSIWPWFTMTWTLLPKCSTKWVEYSKNRQCLNVKVKTIYNLVFILYLHIWKT